MRECVSLESTRSNDWGIVDMTRLPRMRSFLPLCLPPLFARLEEDFPVAAMRRRGVTQVMYYLDFAHYGIPLRLGERLRVRHRLRMHRAAGGRVFWHSKNRLEGHRYAPRDGRDGLITEAGIGRTIHVLTRPLAQPGERAVTTVPEELTQLTAHPWEGGLPELKDLQQIPPGMEISAHEPTHAYADVWGVPNTDTNQHVNVLEYIIGFENQTTRHLHAAGIDVRGHRIRRLRALFRKPCFPGERYCLRSTLYVHGCRTLLHAAFRPQSASGASPERAAVAALVDGEIASPRMSSVE